MWGSRAVQGTTLSWLEAVDVLVVLHAELDEEDSGGLREVRVQLGLLRLLGLGGRLPLLLLLLLLRLFNEHLISWLLRLSSVEMRSVLQDVQRRLHDLLVVHFGDLILDLLLDEVLDYAFVFGRRLLL